MARQEGIGYFPTDVDMLDDDKVYCLMAELGGGDAASAQAFCAYGRLMALLSEIYREGYAIQLDARKRTRIAHKMGLGEQELVQFVEACVRNGLFHEGLWRESSALTSAGIQERYQQARRKSVRKLEGRFVLEDGCGDGSDGADGGAVGNRRDSSGTFPTVPAEEKDKEKERKREREEEEKKGDVTSGAMAEALPCLAVPGEGQSVFIDLSGNPHRTALGAISGSYLASGGRDPTAFASKLRALCPASCRGDPASADECYQLCMTALEKYDPAKGRDPWPLAKTIIVQERGRR